ncbi:mitochondrial ATP synthase g subunit-domain-containing protein [Jimgerdemannia flammicorona]|uniref:Mitochondrial ATP synthase g subunit-domain-containing protein n=1 Tax=Jimgerdemannia flammicorona TaxID=994334 RepID=A0A433DH43_9FUNG|nr:mitochondrial ATP synthase g subunit-domain-containing protein [Jimgerdemannia flammicorona]
MASRFTSALSGFVNSLAAIQRPVVYNAKVAAEIAKQVYVKEGLAFPTAKQFAETRHAVENVNIKSFKSLQLKDLAKGSVVAAEALTFFLIGEVVGRRSLIGYNVPSVGKHGHH